MKVFLTGGTGYFGSHVLECLVEAGHAVTALVRSPERAEPAVRRGAEVIEGDMLRPETWTPVLDRVDALVHTAAKVENWSRTPEAFDRINVDAAVALVEAAVLRKITRTVVASSLFALGPASGREKTEEDRDPEIHPLLYANDYVRTKAVAARRFWEMQGRGNPVMLVYPAVLLGPGSLTQGNHTATVISDVGRKKLPGLIGNGEQLWNLVPVRHAARGLVRALEKGRAGENYILGGEEWTQRRLVERAAELFGVRPPLRRLGTAFPLAVATLAEGWARLRGESPAVTRGEVRLYDADWRVSSRKAVDELGYDAGDLDQAVRETVEWIRRDVWSPDSGVKV